MSEVVVALTTVPAGFDVTSLAQDLVGSGVAACVTVFPSVRSVYTWEGVPQTDEEQQLLVKTTSDQVDGLWEMLRERHPYEVPEFLILPVIGGNDEYVRWIERTTGPKAES
ncbi:MAG: divalent-cation tolerance protein CutA [Vicinamibacterales bacterium]